MVLFYLIMEELTEGDKKLLEDIEKFGWHVLKVSEDDQGPGFCFSVGLFKTFKHPEIFIIGLKADLAHVLINNIGEEIRRGMNYKSGVFYPEIIDGFDCLMIEISQKYYNEYLGYANWYYKDKEFPVLQCIYPTVKGAFPWQKEWPKEIKDLQPILGNLSNIIGGK